MRNLDSALDDMATRLCWPPPDCTCSSTNLDILAKPEFVVIPHATNCNLFQWRMVVNRKREEMIDALCQLAAERRVT